MALVAYSDESDYSEEEDQSSSSSASSFSQPLSSDKIHVSNRTGGNKPSSSLANGKILSGVESIELDDGDFVVPVPKSSSKSNFGSSLLSTLPAASSSRSRNAVLAVDDSDDQLTDVPTKETWQPAQDVLKKGLLNGKAANAAPKPSVSRGAAGSKSGGDGAAAAARGLSKVQQIALESSALGSLLLEKKTVGGKIQLHLPAMTEFAEEEEDEAAGQVADAGDSTRTKRGPSNTGTGLFSLLPKPKNAPKGKEANRSLVPHILSKPPVKRHVPVKTKKPPGATPKVTASAKTSAISGLGDYEASDEEDEDGSGAPSDFFSLEADNSIIVPADKGSFSVGSSEIVNELADASVRLPSSSFVASGPVAVPASSPSSSHNYHPTDSYDVRLEPSTTAIHDSNSAFEAQNSQDQLDPSQMDDEAWRRLTGKKRKAEDLNIIDFNPDDALLSRDELMNQVISQQKPNQSHSKKKGNLPSHQQKRKHQITYLAHQAKEREIELQNEWSTGKAKKMQTRAKYGF